MNWLGLSLFVYTLIPVHFAGHRIGTAEVESALVLHPAVAQAAVVGKMHPIKGDAIVGFVTLQVDYDESPELIIEVSLFYLEQRTNHVVARRVPFTLVSLTHPLHVRTSNDSYATRYAKKLDPLRHRIFCG